MMEHRGPHEISTRLGPAKPQAPVASTRLTTPVVREPETPLPATRLPGEQPVRPRLNLDTIVAGVRHLPALPSVVMQVMALTGDEERSAKEVARAIGNDPNFSVRVLQLANSAFYGLPRSVSTISDAVVLLGMRTVRNMAIAAATHDTLNHALSGYELGQGDLWRHSMACGIASQMLAEQARYPDSEEAFVAGLLHDIGKVILSIHVSDAIDEIQARMEAEAVTFIEAERMVLGFDHAEVGGRIARKWNLPIPLVQAIAWHHQPVQNGHITPLAAIVHVANIVCLMAGAGLGVEGLRVPCNEAAMKILGLLDRDIEALMERLVNHIASTQPLFEVHQLCGPGEARMRRRA